MLSGKEIPRTQREICGLRGKMKFQSEKEINHNEVNYVIKSRTI